MKNVIHISKPTTKALEYIKEHIAQKREAKVKIAGFVKTLCTPEVKRRVSAK